VICIFKVLDLIPSISGAKIMDEKAKIGRKLHSYKRCPGYIAPVLYMAFTQQQIKLESCSNPL